VTVNDREFRQYLTDKRLEHQRQEAIAANTASEPAPLKKSPTTAKRLKSQKTRFA
jgi:hypothetical protein